jgi:hypothetical protein
MEPLGSRYNPKIMVEQTKKLKDSQKTFLNQVLNL